MLASFSGTIPYPKQCTHTRKAESGALLQLVQLEGITLGPDRSTDISMSDIILMCALDGE